MPSPADEAGCELKRVIFDPASLRALPSPADEAGCELKLLQNTQHHSCVSITR